VVAVLGVGEFVGYYVVLNLSRGENQPPIEHDFSRSIFPPPTGKLANVDVYVFQPEFCDVVISPAGKLSLCGSAVPIHDSLPLPRRTHFVITWHGEDELPAVEP
jgi:hypothetical protein